MAAIRPNPTLTEDLISDILIRVPVKSLLCFQSVSKTWLSLIKHPAFVKSQLLRSITSETDHTLIINPWAGASSAENKILLLHVDSRQIVADLKFSYPRGEFKSVPDVTIVGSANGIVCVAVAYLEIEPETSIYLWNPAIRQSKVIPSFGHELGAQAFGFGYDPIDHDFKVVSVVSAPSRSAEVYSANRNVWRKVPDPIDTPLNGDFDVCVNGFLCGIGEYGMMAFDLYKEVLNCAIKLPVISIVDDDDETRIIESNEARIIEFNKSIAVIILWDDGLNDDKKINMWTLDDDACLRVGGVEASWTLMFSIDTGMLSDIVHGYFSNGDLLIIMDSAYTWISCNIETKEAKIVRLSVDMARHLHTRHIYKYTESLVSVAGFKQVDWNADEYDD